jgi:hypothetical protein
MAGATAPAFLFGARASALRASASSPGGATRLRDAGAAFFWGGSSSPRVRLGSSPGGAIKVAEWRPCFFVGPPSAAAHSAAAQPTISGARRIPGVRANRS